ncbi:MAG TPA: hypothetical protein VFE07_07215 [Marmoricola sp.]|nr:hypothetical protein [Marmoricola sp.]
MKATHVRPLLAFWLLASVAAFITSVGMRAPSTSPVRAGAPTASVTGTTPSNAVSERVQQVRPGTSLTSIVLPGVWTSAAAAEHAAADVGSPGLPGVSIDGTTLVPATAVSAPGGASGSGGSTGQSGGSGDGTAAARPTGTTTAAPTTGPGKGRGNGHGPNDHSTSHPGKGRGH